MIREKIFSRDNIFTPSQAFISLRHSINDRQEILPRIERDNLELGTAGLFALAFFENPDQVLVSIIDHQLHQAPDCLLLDEKKKIIDLVEVTHFSGRSHIEGIVRFLKRTKLAPERSYSSDTIIVCHWMGLLSENINWKLIQNRLSNSFKNNPVFIMGRIDRLRPVYVLVQLHPHFQIKKIDLFE